MYLVYLICLCITTNSIIVMIWFVVHLSLEIIQALGASSSISIESYFGPWNIADITRLAL